MNDQSREQPRLSSPDANFEQLTQPLISYAEAMSQGMQTMGDEVSRFISDRAQKTSAAIADISHCGNPAKAVEVQFRWIASLMNDYTEESSRLFTISGRIMQNMLTPRSK